jgi:hypothetical protein
MNTAILAKNFKIYENNSSLRCGNPEQIKKKSRLVNVTIDLPLQTFEICLPQYVVTTTIPKCSCLYTCVTTKEFSGATFYLFRNM